MIYDTTNTFVAPDVTTYDLQSNTTSFHSASAQTSSGTLSVITP